MKPAVVEMVRAPGVPEGWRLVPAVATDAIEQAAADYLGACVKAGELWDAMLAAAPQPPEAAPALPSEPAFDLLAHIRRHMEFSARTFGPGPRAAGVIDHIRKELREIEAAPHDLEEWVDVWMLALDGAWRSGHTPEQIVAQIQAKQAKNEGRKWPDWRTADPGKAIEHDRSADAPAPAAALPSEPADPYAHFEREHAQNAPAPAAAQATPDHFPDAGGMVAQATPPLPLPADATAAEVAAAFTYGMREPSRIPIVRRIADHLRDDLSPSLRVLLLDCQTLFEAQATGAQAERPASLRCAGCDLPNGCPEYCRCGQPPVASATGAQAEAPAFPDTCDGKEQDAFEAWAKAERYNMELHPLHWLFLNERTYAARQGWKAGLLYAVQQMRDAQAPAAAVPPLSGAMLREIAGRLQPLESMSGEEQVSAWWKHYAGHVRNALRAQAAAVPPAPLTDELLQALHTADRTFAESGLLACHAARKEIRAAIAKVTGAQR